MVDRRAERLGLEGGAAGDGLAERAGAEVVDVERQVIAVVLDVADGEHDDGAALDGLGDLLPGQAVVSMHGLVLLQVR